MNKLYLGIIAAVLLFFVTLFFIKKDRSQPAASGKQAAAVEEPAGMAAVQEGLALPNYDSPESLVADYDNAKEYLPISENAFKVQLTDYFVCKAALQGSDAPCADIDRIHSAQLPAEAGPRSFPPYICKNVYWEARMLHEMASGGGTFEAYRMFDGIQPAAGEEHEDSPEEIIAEAKRMAPIYVKGDLAALCKAQAAEARANYDNRDPKEFCSDNVFLLGDPDRCQSSPTPEYCRNRANLLRAVREKKPGYASGTLYEPLVSKDASCAGLGKAIIAAYRDQSSLGFFNKRLELKELRTTTSVRSQTERLKAAEQLRLAEEKAIMEKQGQESAERMAAELELQQREAEALREKERIEKFNNARGQDEFTRRKKGLKMRSGDIKGSKPKGEKNQR